MAKILVVEDDFDGRNLLDFLLKQRGFEVVTAVDGLQGQRLAIFENPDFIITDLSMPNEGGVAMIEHLRKGAEEAKIPIVVYTAYSSDFYQSAIDAGALKVFSKPIELFDMLRYVSESFQQAETS